MNGARQHWAFPVVLTFMGLALGIVTTLAVVSSQYGGDRKQIQINTDLVAKHGLDIETLRVEAEQAKGAATLLRADVDRLNQIAVKKTDEWPTVIDSIRGLKDASAQATADYLRLRSRLDQHERDDLDLLRQRAQGH